MARRTHLPVPVALLLALALVAGCGPDAPDAAPAAAGPEPAAPPAAAAPPVRPPADAGPPPLTPDGWGPIRIGMTVAEVTAAAGPDANPEAVGGPEPERCDEFRPRDLPEGMLVMVEEGRVTRISLLRGRAIATQAGITVGDPASAVRAAHPTGLEAGPHKYVEAPAEYLTVWRVAPPDPEARGLVYEIGRDGRVLHVHAGSASIRYVEGCL